MPISNAPKTPPLPRVLVREETVMGRPPNDPGTAYEEQPIVMARARDRRSVKAARTAVAAAAGFVDHAESYLGGVTLDLAHAHDALLALERARAALHVALAALLTSTNAYTTEGE